MTTKGKTRRQFLKIFGISSCSLYFGCNSAVYSILQKDCPDKNKYGEKLRIMSFNIANARGNNDEFFGSQPREKVLRNLDWIAAIIKNFNIDIACLNEVDFNSLRTQNIDMAKYIAEKTCYNHVISERLFALPVVLEVGNAVISHYPLRLNMYRQYGEKIFGQARHAFKSFLDFDVIYEKNKQLNMVLTHLDNQSEYVRREQTAILRTHLEAKKHPFVLLGDFNSSAEGESVRHLTKDGFVRNPYLGKPTYPSNRPTVQIDYIFVSAGLSIDNYHSIGNRVSDHLPVMGDIFIE